MKVKSKQQPEKKDERKYNNPQPTGHKGVGIPPPDLRDGRVTSSSGGAQYHKRFRTTKKKAAREKDAAGHFIWIRKDIWAAVEIYKNKHNRTNRSVVEEALYNFLIKESRVEGVEDLGTDPERTSWTVDED